MALAVVAQHARDAARIDPTQQITHLSSEERGQLATLVEGRRL